MDHYRSFIKIFKKNSLLCLMTDLQKLVIPITLIRCPSRFFDLDDSGSYFGTGQFALISKRRKRSNLDSPF